jgi:hypothetical protein
MMGILPEALVITDVYDSRFFREFRETDSLDMIQDRDFIYVFEVAVDHPPRLVKPPVPPRVRNQATTLANGDKAPDNSEVATTTVTSLEQAHKQRTTEENDQNVKNGNHYEDQNQEIKSQGEEEKNTQDQSQQQQDESEDKEKGKKSWNSDDEGGIDSTRKNDYYASYNRSFKVFTLCLTIC